jgi:hypothetical protein
MKIKQIYFFYKGNGMGYDPVEDELLSSLENYIIKTDEVVKREGTDFLFSQLEKIHPFINEKEPQTEEHLTMREIWSLNIYYLSKKGYLKNDNLNGLSIVYE